MSVSNAVGQHPSKSHQSFLGIITHTLGQCQWERGGQMSLNKWSCVGVPQHFPGCWLMVLRCPCMCSVLVSLKLLHDFEQFV